MTEERLLDSDDIEEEAKPQRKENSTIRQLREAQEAAAAERDEARERAAKAEAAVLSQSGLTEKQQAAFQAMGYSIDQVEQFRKDVLGVEDAPEAEATEAVEADEAEEEAPAGALHTPTPTGVGAPKGAREYTSNDIVELMQTDPVKADRLLRSGKVVRKEFNPGGPRF